MAETTLPAQTVRIDCPCGEEIRFDAHLLNRIIQCRHCRRYLRPALQFMLVDRSLAPNLTVQCTCGRFIVQPSDKVGKRVRCKVCKNHLMMPQPVVKFNVEGFVRIPRKVLQNQLTKVQRQKERAPKEMTRLQSAGHAGRITLGPGEHICVNLRCGALMRARATVCPKCGTNRITGRRYEGSGPEGDPRGKWKMV
jgi:hypothetical protein